MTASRRSLPAYAVLLIATVLLGLATRRYPTAFPDVIAAYGGDVLWAAMVFWLAALSLRDAPTMRLAAIALGVSVAVELSQLHHAPWIETLRATRLGALVLGQGFLWSDLVCYATGVASAAAIDRVFARHRSPLGAHRLAGIDGEHAPHRHETREESDEQHDPRR